MQKFILVFLFLVTACQSATPTVVALPSPTGTLPPSPTPLPVIDTPAPTPTLDASATPFPRFFTNEFDTSPVDWRILQSGSDTVPLVKSENSQVTLKIDTPFTWTYAVYGAQEYGNVRVDARFANQAGSPASIGLVCRYSEGEGWLEYNVSTDGTYNVLYGQWLAPGIADYLPVLSASSNAIQPSGSSQEIGLLCSGTTLSLFIDQVLIRNVDVSRFEQVPGKVGFTVSSFENTPVIAAFDWLKVSEP